MKENFKYNCVNPEDFEELEYIIDNMEKITYEEFSKEINSEDLNILECDLGYNDEFPITRDYHVNFGKCYLSKKRKTAYILVHSCIEYVFY